MYCLEFPFTHFHGAFLKLHAFLRCDGSEFAESCDGPITMIIWIWLIYVPYLIWSSLIHRFFSIGLSRHLLLEIYSSKYKVVLILCRPSNVFAIIENYCVWTDPYNHFTYLSQSFKLFCTVVILSVIIICGLLETNQVLWVVHFMSPTLIKGYIYGWKLKVLKQYQSNYFRWAQCIYF